MVASRGVVCPDAQERCDVAVLIQCLCDALALSIAAGDTGIALNPSW